MFQVFQHKTLIKEFNDILDALAYVRKNELIGYKIYKKEGEALVLMARGI